MKDFLKNNLKVIIAIVITAIISGGSVYAATQILASDVVYDNTNSGLSATNAQDALDELNTKANNMVPIDPDTFQTNKAKTVYASNKGICIKRNNKLNCFKINNWNEEKDHIQQVFSDVNCTVDSSNMSVNCFASDFICTVVSFYMNCTDRSDSSYCSVNYSDGSVNCN